MTIAGAPAAPQPARSQSARSALIVKFGAIGDVIMAIPGAAELYAAGYAVTWIAGRAVAPVLELYPWIRVIAVDEAALVRGGRLKRIRTLLSLWQKLRKTLGGQTFDLVATLYYDRRYKLLTWPVRARRQISLSHEDRTRRLLPGRHHTDEFARILCSLPDQETPRQLAPVRAEGLPPSAHPSQPGRPRIVLVPAGARNLLRDDALRRWAVESYVAVAAALIERGCEIVLAGGPDDRWASDHFRALATDTLAPQFSDQIGTLSLVETLALLDSAEVTVTHDTGPLHLAGITRTAIVTVFGPTDPHGRLPQRANCVALWGGEGFACRPCYDGRDYAPCSHNGCMDQVTPDMVLAQVEELLRARRDGQDLPPRVLAPRHTGMVEIQPAPVAETFR